MMYVPFDQSKENPEVSQTNLETPVQWLKI